MKRRFKKGDYVLFKTRDGMASVPGRLDIAMIIKGPKEHYDTKPLNFDKVEGADKWSLSLFDSDILCKVGKMNAKRYNDLLKITHAIYDDLFSKIKNTLSDKEKMIAEYLISKDPSLKEKPKPKRKTKKK